MGSGGGSSGAQTVTQTTELPDYVKGPATRYLARAEELSQLPYETYEGTRIAPLNSVHNYALDQGRAMMGSVLPGALGQMGNFASGQFNQPAYIHPFLGPQVPGVGSPNPGFSGYSPQPQPMPGMPDTSGKGAGAGGMTSPGFPQVPPIPGMPPGGGGGGGTPPGTPPGPPPPAPVPTPRRAPPPPVVVPPPGSGGGAPPANDIPGALPGETREQTEERLRDERIREEERRRDGGGN